MNGLKILVVSVIAGIVITLLSAYVISTPSQLVGAVWHGFPAAWLRYLVVGPQYNPWAVDYVGFIVDAVLWSVVVGLLLRALPRSKSGRAHRTRR
jgi:hypothetical protein